MAKPKDVAVAETQIDKKNRMQAEGKVAMAEYLARAAAIDKNTLRLRALRLAKEAADREAALANPPEPPKPKKKRTPAAPTKSPVAESNAVEPNTVESDAVEPQKTKNA